MTNPWPQQLPAYAALSKPLAARARHAAQLARRTYTSAVGTCIAVELDFMASQNWSGDDHYLALLIEAVHTDARRLGISESAA